jgi:hypothetical protein
MADYKTVLLLLRLMPGPWVYLLCLSSLDIRGVRAALSYRSSNNKSKQKKSIPSGPWVQLVKDEREKIKLC